MQQTKAAVGHAPEDGSCPEYCGTYSCDADLNCYDSCQGDLQCGPTALCNLSSQTCEPAFTGICGLYAPSESSEDCYTDCRNDTMCAAGAYCFEGSVCKRDLCLGKQVDDGRGCTQDDCDRDTGVVTHTPYTQTILCWDNSYCDGYGMCNSAGDCVEGAFEPPDLEDGNRCTADICNPATSEVTHPALNVDDDNPCTTDSCNPATGPSHVPVPLGTACDNDDKCDGHEQCNAFGICTPGSPPVVSDGNACTFDYCDHATGVHNDPRAVNFPCLDNDRCNGDEHCDGSTHCLSGTPPPVDDGNPCTNDSCSATAGVTHLLASLGSSCDDATLCNGRETCSGTGRCLPGQPPNVDDHNPCTVDSCNALLGETHAPVAPNTSCADANPCNGAEVCDSSGVCATGQPPVLDDGNPCTADSCSPTLGVQHAPVASGVACDDGTVCNGREQCDGAKHCLPGTAPTLDDAKPCTTDTCDPVAGVKHQALDDGSACSDGNACTTMDSCHAGECTAGAAVSCAAVDSCHTAACSPANGQCAQTPKQDGTACQSANVCLQNTTCQSGVCGGGTPVSVDDHNPCTVDLCDAGTGPSHAPIATGTSCSDTNPCNGEEACNSGNCVAGQAPIVDDGNPCTADSCSPTLGVQHAAIATGVACDDGTVCNGHEQCDGAKHCVAGVPLVLNDGNPCTTDSCNPITGPAHHPATSGTACGDNNACNGQETCDGAGDCQPGPPPALSDGNPCTSDSCDVATGTIVHSPLSLGSGCDDSTVCNGREICNGQGACTPGTPEPIDDGKPCTVDSCDPIAGVTHQAVTVGTSCDDQTVCNGHEICDAAGSCLVGIAPALDDHNPCTNDSCDPVAGVVHAPAVSNTSCANGNACDGDERCNAGGLCLPGSPAPVDDSNPCTVDSCDTATGVVTHHAVAGGTSCANGSLCDGAETCDGNGACNPGVTLVVDDGDPCTTDSCDPFVGVKHVRSASASCAVPGFWQTLVASQPSPRDGAAGVFTSAGELFVFGGENAGAGLADTWLWSAVQNSWRRGAGGPSVRSGAGVAFDSQRQRVIVVGGVAGADASSAYLGDVWEYAPASDTWLARTTSGPAPSSRAMAAFAYNSQLQRGLLFGGVGATHLSDTWEWTAATGAWAQLSAVGPSARFGSAFAFDPGRGMFVLFGGSPPGVTGGALNDTWTFNASTGQWALLNPVTKPPARAGATMTFDASVSRLVMVGGTSVDALNLSDAWEFDLASASWTQLGSNVPVQTGGVIGFDPTLGQVLVASGLGYSDSGRFSTDFNAVWSFSRANGQWLSRAGASAPARLNLGAAFNSASGRIVTRAMVDQQDTSTRPMMWDYDGASRQWAATDASAAETNFGSGAFKQAANVVNSLVYDSDRNLTLQVTAWPTVIGTAWGEIQIREWDGVRWKAGCDVLATQNVDIGMDKASAIYDPPRKRVLLFGYSKVVSIKPASCTTSLITTSGPGPVALESIALGWDADRDLFVTSGGVRSGEPQAETWEFDPLVNTWTARAPGPSPRSAAAMAYDPQRKKLVLYGGSYLFGPALRDTWEYSVATHAWSQLSSGGGPDKTRAWIVFDAKRQKSVLISTAGAIWTWDGSTWVPELNSVAPSARTGLSGGWAPNIGAGLFFGGTSGDGRRTFLSDLWLWNGGWHLASAAGNPSPLAWDNAWEASGRTVVSVGPAARTGHVFATGYNGNSYAAVLFGGEGDSGLLGDTWTLDEASLQWQSRTPNSFDPSPRTGHAATLFPGKGYLMFGGLGTSAGQDTLLNDTWSWIDGWSKLPLSGAAPSVRFAHAMATDQNTNKVILFGGRDASGVLGDTWQLDLSTLQSVGWQKLNPSNAPKPRFGHAMNYDSVRQRIVLTGGEGALPGTAFGDTWEWDGAALNWIKRNVGVMDGRAGQTAFFDQAQGQSIVFGGLAHDAAGHAARTYGDTLAFTGASQVDPPALKDNGDKCTTAASCGSGLCVDGVCCNTTCTGQCAACDVAGLEGTCSPSKGVPHGSRTSCGGSGGVCGAQCDGSDTTACHPAPSGTNCAAGLGCNNGSLVQGPGTCDGAGTCSQAVTSCSPYMCFGPPDLPTAQCMTSCQTDGYCFSADYRCSRPGGICYLAAKIAPNGVSVSPAAPKVGTPMTITVQPLPAGANYVYTFRVVTDAGNFRLPCQLVTSKTCSYTPVATDIGPASVTVFAQAPSAQNGYDTSQTITTTIGAAQ